MPSLLTAASSPSSSVIDFEDALSGNLTLRSNSSGRLSPSASCEDHEGWKNLRGGRHRRLCARKGALTVTADGWQGGFCGHCATDPAVQCAQSACVCLPAAAGPSSTDEEGYTSARSRASPASPHRAIRRERSRLRFSSMFGAAVRAASAL